SAPAKRRRPPFVLTLYGGCLHIVSIQQGERHMITERVTDESVGLRADARRNRDRVLKIAMQHFASRGVNASLEEIAKAAGVGAGTLYRHFPSREALLAAALQDRQAELREQARTAQ